MSLGWRIADGAAAALFALGALVQLNDPDPAAWFAIYALAAGACGLGAAGRPSAVLAGGVAAVSLGWAAWMSRGAIPQGQPMAGSNLPGLLGDELFREAAGLLILAGWCGALAWRAGRSAPTEETAT